MRRRTGPTAAWPRGEAAAAAAVLAELGALDELLEAAAREDVAASDSALLIGAELLAELLHTADGWVVCNRGAAGDCALRLWAEGHPAPVELLRERMATLLSQHGLACRGRARCRLPTEFEATGRLLMSCETCGSNAVVV